MIQLTLDLTTAQIVIAALRTRQRAFGHGSERYEVCKRVADERVADELEQQVPVDNRLEGLDGG